jgi:Lar family restriction alleviation protein
MDELKSCPFCGGEARMFTLNNENASRVRYYVRCRKCDARTGRHVSQRLAEKAWNKRTMTHEQIPQQEDCRER